MEEYKTYNQLVTAVAPDVMCYRLKPLCLGHVLLLKAMDNGFITGEFNHLLDINNIIGELTINNNVKLQGDFLIAVMVCSTYYDDFLEEYQSGNSIVDGINKMMQLVKDRKVNGAEEIYNFAHYINRGTQTYDYNPIIKNDGAIKDVPFAFEEIIKNSLMTETTYTREQILNLPLVETYNDYLIMAHNAGLISVTSKNTFDLMKEMKEEKANV